MIGISFRRLEAKQQRRAAINAARAAQFEDAAKDAQQLLNDADEWNLADEDEGDGGLPKHLQQDEVLVRTRRHKSKRKGKKIDEEAAAAFGLVVGKDAGEHRHWGGTHDWENNIIKAEGEWEEPPPVEGETEDPYAAWDAQQDAEENPDDDLVFGEDETSPLAAQVEAKLAFLEETDTDGEDDGGVKI